MIQASRHGQVDSAFACRSGSTRSNLTAAKVHKGYTLIQCIPLLVEKTCVAPDVTLRFTTCKQVSVQAREPP